MIVLDVVDVDDDDDDAIDEVVEGDGIVSAVICDNNGDDRMNHTLLSDHTPTPVPAYPRLVLQLPFTGNDPTSITIHHTTPIPYHGHVTYD
jgi:hypothetical protein